MLVILATQVPPPRGQAPPTTTGITALGQWADYAHPSSGSSPDPSPGWYVVVDATTQRQALRRAVVVVPVYRWCRTKPVRAPGQVAPRRPEAAPVCRRGLPRAGPLLPVRLPEIRIRLLSRPRRRARQFATAVQRRGDLNWTRAWVESIVWRIWHLPLMILAGTGISAARKSMGMNVGRAPGDA